MPTVQFKGKIVPSTAYTLNLKDIPQIHYKISESDLEVDITIFVDASILTVDCSANRLDDDAFSQIHKIAFDLARASVNLMAFSTGITLSVVFDEMVKDGVHSALVLFDPRRAELCTVLKSGDIGSPIALDQILQIVLSEPAVFLALDDLITATGLHHLMTVNTARSVEGIRHAMAPGLSRDQQWEIFRTSLNVDKAYIRLITDTSTSGRHGESKFVPGAITTEIVKRAWVLMNRFIEFRKRGNVALPTEEFPLLVG